MSSASHTLKSIAHYNHFSTLWIENRLHHLRFYCCGVKPESTTSFFILFTNILFGFPACPIPPSFITESKQSEWAGIPIQEPEDHISCHHPREWPTEHQGTATARRTCYDDGYPTRLTWRWVPLHTALTKPKIHSDYWLYYLVTKNIIRIYKKLLWMDFTKLKKKLMTIIEYYPAF